MFGTDPALLQQALQQQQHQSWQQDIQPDVFSLGQRLGNQAGGMLGNALGNAMGYQDPRLADAMVDKQILQKSVEDAKTAGVDINDPMAFGKVYATNQMNAGRPQKAYAVIQQMQSMAKTTSETAKNNAEAAAKLREKAYTVVGKNAIENATGNWKTPPESALGGEVNNNFDAMDFLTKVQKAKDAGEPIPPDVQNRAIAFYEYVNKPQMGPNGVIVSPPDIRHLDPRRGGSPIPGVPVIPGAPVQDASQPDAKLAAYADYLAQQGVPDNVIQNTVATLKASGKPVPKQGGARTDMMFGRAISEVPSIKDARQIEQGFKQEEQLRDDFSKAVKPSQDILEQAQKVKVLVSDPYNPSALNAAATLGQHLLEPGNQALPGEIKRLIGGGNVAEQLRGFVSAVLVGKPSDQQVKWFVDFANKITDTALNTYKSTLSEYHTTVSGYAKDNPKITPGRVVTAEQLSRFEGVPYVRTDEDYKKLPSGTTFYSVSDLKMRKKP